MTDIAQEFKANPAVFKEKASKFTEQHASQKVKGQMRSRSRSPLRSVENEAK